MAYDLLLKNGTVVDGSGAPRFRADVAVAGDRIAEIGKISDGAKRVIDASDLIVAPGFIDPHTHYDAQICWDPLLSCTSWHGITSVMMGNCGVGGVGSHQRRGDSVRVADQGNHVGMGNLSRISRRGPETRLRCESWLPRAADSVSALRDGHRIDGARGDA